MSKRGSVNDADDDMCPQPLSSKPHISAEDCDFDPWAIARNPVLAAKVMQVLAEWSFIDVHIVRIATGLLRSEFGPAAALLAGLHDSDAVRVAVRELIRYRVPTKDRWLFNEALKVVSAFSGRRNLYAHGLWGYTDKLPRSLLLIQTRDLIRHSGETEAERRAIDLWAAESHASGFNVAAYNSAPYMGAPAIRPRPPLPRTIDTARICEFTEKDLITDLDRVRDAARCVAHCARLVRGGAEAARSRSWLQTRLPAPEQPEARRNPPPEPPPE